jgi:hypothetical protein
MELYNNFFDQVLKVPIPCEFPSHSNCIQDNSSYVTTSEEEDSDYDESHIEVKVELAKDLYTLDSPYPGIQVYTSPKAQFVCYLDELWHIRIGSSFTQVAVGWGLYGEVEPKFEGNKQDIKIKQCYMESGVEITRIVDPSEKNKMVMFQIAFTGTNVPTPVNYRIDFLNGKKTIKLKGELPDALEVIWKRILDDCPPADHSVIQHTIFTTESLFNRVSDYHIEEIKSRGYCKTMHFFEGALVFSTSIVRSLQIPERMLMRSVAIGTQFTFPMVRTQNWSDDEDHLLLSDEQGMYLEGLQFVGVEPIAHQNPFLQNQVAIVYSLGPMVRLGEDFQVKISYTNLSASFNCFKECNSLQEELVNMYQEPLYHFSNQMKTPLLTQGFTHEDKTFDERCDFEHTFSDKDHFLSLLEKDAVKRIRGFYVPGDVEAMEAAVMSPYQNAHLVTGYAEKLIQNASARID